MSETEAHVVYSMLRMDGGNLREYGPLLLTDRLPDSVATAVDLILRGKAAVVTKGNVKRVRDMVLRDTGLE